MYSFPLWFVEMFWLFGNLWGSNKNIDNVYSVSDCFSRNNLSGFKGLNSDRRWGRITDLTEFFNNCSEIPDIKTERVERKVNGDFVITVAVTADSAVCHKCGRDITKFYGYGRETELRHLPMPGHKTYIRIRPKRYECPYCEGNPTTTQKVSRYMSGSSHTNAYEEHIIFAMVSSTVADVSMKEDIGYEGNNRKTCGKSGRSEIFPADRYYRNWRKYRLRRVIRTL